VSRPTLLDLDETGYHKLEEVRYQIRRFLAFSENAARQSGIEPQQHMALLVIKGTPRGEEATIGRIAERLFLKHHSAVGLVDRLQSLGLVSRQSDPHDARKVVVQLTKRGEDMLHRLSLSHRTQLDETGPRLANALREISRNVHSTSK
jgi:DNA-binding MarR family transcriptional regulator